MLSSLVIVQVILLPQPPGTQHCVWMIHCFLLMDATFSFFFVFVVLGFELRASCLLGKVPYHLSLSASPFF
jgi:hypothetical protein